jgi:hypothetical protein
MISSSNKMIGVNLASYTQIGADEKENPRGWIEYGDKNLYPQYLIEVSEQSPVHGSLVRSISQMVAGKKIYSDSIEAISMMKKLGIDKAINNTAYDLVMQGAIYWEVIWSMDKTQPAKVNQLPAECCRLAYDKVSGDVTGIYYSKDWSNLRMRRNTPVYIPLLDERQKENQSRQVKIKFKNSSDANYYSKPDYIAAMNYIELSRQIGIFHVNNIQNGLFPSFVVNMNNGVPETDEEMDIEKRNIERNVSGAVNAGKFLIFFNENKERAAEFIPFPTNDADKLYDMLEQTCTRQIMIAHRVTSPLLFGIRDGSGLGSNKDEMETALKIFNEQVIEPSQRIICECAEEILQLANVSADVFIVMNDEEINSTTGNKTSVEEAQQVLDASQISSALEIVAKVKEGILTEQQAIIFLIQFLQLPEEVAKSFFISEGQIAVQKLCTHLKKKVKLAIPDSFEPTNEMAAEAELGLKWREEFGRGGTEVGVARARDISNKRNLSYDTVKRMNSYFARHEVDKEATGWNDGEEGFPTAGRIAWQLWGGDAGRDWASRIVERYREEELSDIPEFTKEDESFWREKLSKVGEIVDEDEWELVYEEEVGTSEEESDIIKKLVNVNMSYSSYANPDEKSDWGDSGLYKLRYKYSENISANSRDFCRDMVGLSKGGYVYRYEDIEAMSEQGVNGNFAPQGQSTYDLFSWKGGAYCHHSWLRRIYFRKRENGRFLPNDGLSNDERVKDSNLPFLKPKGRESIRPINTPNRGSLKNQD